MDILDQLLDSHPPEPTPEDRHWSPFQLAVFDACEQGSDNLLINAVAGSGKSTTLVRAMGNCQGNSLFLAFNRAIMLEMKGKVGGNGEVKTLNALGHWLIMKHRRGAELDANKSLVILKGIMGESQDYKDYSYTLKRVISLMKNCAFGLTGEFTVDDVVQLIDSYQMDIPFERLSEFATIATRAFIQSLQYKNSFDYDDQLYIPLLENWQYPYYSNIFIDECQDLSPVQHLMLEQMAKMGSRIIAVGDPHQAIYGFRGALVDSMELLAKRFSMKELPLSISYRCSRSVIAEAQQYCPHIEARSEAPLGLVRYREDMDDSEGYCTEDPPLFSNSLIVCRNNAPMFRAILKHVRAKSPCRVLTNFLDSFQGFIRGFKCIRTSELIPKLDLWFEREKEAALKKGFRSKVAGLADKYETAKLLAQEFSLVDDMLHMVKRLGECTVGPIFSTIHKAKGLEHENVYILRPDLMPSPYAMTEDAKQQEANLIYVAITRAKLNLTYGISPKGY